MIDRMYLQALKWPYLVLLCLIYIAWATPAFADLRLEITQGNDRAAPIAVVPFDWQGSGMLPEDIAKVVGNDLARTPYFDPMPRENLISLPTRQEDVIYRDWRMVKANYVLIGRVKRQDNNELLIQYELYDVLKQERMLAEQVRGTPQELRSRAHFISDRIYQAVTGERGIFSTRIAYVTAQRRGPGAYDFQLNVADADGRRAKAILSSRHPILSPSWAPDGRRLAYVSFETGRAAIFVQNVATGKRYQLTDFRGLNGAPSWSPDGQKVAMTLSKDGNPEIYIYDMNQNRLRRVTRHYAIDTEPSWSPDGQRLLFTSSRSGGPQIYEVEVNSGDVRRLTYDGNYNARASYSPKGDEIFMVHREEGFLNFHIAAMNLDSGRLRSLTSMPLDESPSVAPNGSMVIYAMQKGGKGVLGVVSTDGRVQYQLPAIEGDVREPAWSPYLH